MLWSLFLVFLRIGLFSFGGGYAMIPVLQHEVEAHRWMSTESFVHTMALAGMGPGPIAANAATLIGYETAGIPGAIAATAGIVMPSLLLMVGIAGYLRQWQHSGWMRVSFYGLRPVIAGMMLFSAVHFGLSGLAPHVSALLDWHVIGTLLIIAAAVAGMLKFRLHPGVVLALSGVFGIVLFQ